MSLEVNEKYIKVPQVTTTERNALTAANGMLVYDTDLNAFYKYENGSWSTFAGGSAYSRTVVSGNLTATNDTDYTLVASATFTDPTPVEGKGYTVLLRNGTATLGGTAYSTVGQLLWRVYHSGAWATYQLATQTQVGNTLFITTGNQTTTSDTAQNITGLSVTLLANTRYKIHGFIRFGVNNTGGTKFAATIPSGSMDIALFGVGSTTTSFTRALLTSSGTLSAVSFLNTNSTNGWVFLDGEVSVGVTGGTLQFQFASGTATQTSTINQLGTEIQVTSIA